MNVRSTVIVFLFTLLAFGATAGPGHSHEPVTQEKAEQIASRIVSTLVEKMVVEDSWMSSEVKESRQKKFEGRKEWVVSYQNDAVEDPSMRTLYIFLTLSGEYIAANYTGD